MDNIIHLDEGKVKKQLGEMVLGTVEQTLNAMLDAEADEITQAPIQQIARVLNSDINLVALKIDTLRSQGYELRPQEHRNDFLRYDR